MARIRTIKPNHVNDKELSKVTLQAHLLWVLSWCFSDDDGVFENDPLLIKSQLFPRRTDIRVEQIEQWLGQLVKARFIIPFTHDGEGYYLHRTFKIHQKIDRPQPSKIPENVIRRIIDECSTIVQPCIVLDSIVREKESTHAREAQAPTLPLSEIEVKFKAFNEWLLKNAPQVSKMKEPFTIKQYQKLLKDFPGKNELLKDVLLAMHNKVDLLKKYTSANLTLRKWIIVRNDKPELNGNNNYQEERSRVEERTRKLGES